MRKKSFHFMGMGAEIQLVAAGRADDARMKAGRRSMCVRLTMYPSRCSHECAHAAGGARMLQHTRSN